MKNWSERLEPTDFTATYKVNNVIYELQSPHQHIMLFENATMGRVLAIDGVVQTTENDEFTYHEMLVHVPILAHGAAKKILVIGGGDGGCIKELFKHFSIESVTLVDIDESVITISQKYLEKICGNAFSDPRLNIVISDGAIFVKECVEKFDLIIVDSPDPIGAGEILFSKEFYSNCKRVMSDSSVLITQNGVPFTQGKELQRSISIWRTLFSDSRCYLTNVPSYIGGPLAIGWATNDINLRSTPLEVIEERFKKALIKCDYYTPETHIAAFALPKYIRKLL